jgi:rubrerythrin
MFDPIERKAMTTMFDDEAGIIHEPEIIIGTFYCETCDKTFEFEETSYPGNRSNADLPCPTCGAVLGTAEEDAELIKTTNGRSPDRFDTD